MSKINIVCEECGKEVEKESGEVTRSLKLGRHFFCNNSCGAKYSNRPRKAKEISAICPTCQKSFVTFDKKRKKRASVFCSRVCASNGSITDKRRAGNRIGGLKSKGNLLPNHETLKRREAWKYVLLKKYLEETGEDFEFEYPLHGFVFDLALVKKKILIEFDGPEHQVKGNKAFISGKEKERIAKKNGFILLRRSVIPSTVIDPQTIEDI